MMTPRPGRITQSATLPSASRFREEDIRTTPEFPRVRREAWSLKRDEFRQAEFLERDRVSGADGAA